MTTQLPEPAKVWTRYVALGDSFTEGMSDEDPARAGAYVGWADRLAMQLAAVAAGHDESFRYANLAVRGRLLADVVGPQLDRAVSLGPDLVSMVGGGNDLLRPGVDVDDIASRLDAAVVRLRETGADVMLATPVDPVAAPLIRRLRGRFAVHTSNLFSIAHRHGCYVLNQWGMRVLTDGRMWSQDRIHMTAEGHRRVALAAYSALGYDTEDEWRVPLDPAPVVSRRQSAAENLAWARDHLAPWVRRRLRGRSSGDTVTAKRPDLEPVTSPDSVPPPVTAHPAD